MNGFGQRLCLPIVNRRRAWRCAFDVSPTLYTTLEQYDSGSSVYKQICFVCTFHREIPFVYITKNNNKNNDDDINSDEGISQDPKKLPSTHRFSKKVLQKGSPKIKQDPQLFYHPKLFPLSSYFQRSSRRCPAPCRQRQCLHGPAFDARC